MIDKDSDISDVRDNYARQTGRQEPGRAPGISHF